MLHASTHKLLDGPNSTQAAELTAADAVASRGLSVIMDDLDHSVYIADQDWDSFFQECEECNIQQGALAGLDDSGLSDFDEAEFCRTNQEVRGSLESRPSIDSQPSFEARPVEHYVTTIRRDGLEDALSARGNEDPGSLACADQPSKDLSKDSTLEFRLHGATDPAGSGCATCGGDVNQETARGSENVSGSIVSEPWIEANTIQKINLLTVSAPRGEAALHDSKYVAEEHVLQSLQDDNVDKHYRDNSEGDTCCVLKAPQEGMSLEVVPSRPGQSSLTTPSSSFADLQEDISVNSDAQSQANIPAIAEHISECDKIPSKEKERWFVTVDISQTHSREKPRTSVKKKRRKKSCIEDGLGLESGYKGQDPDVQSNSGAERLGVSVPESQGINVNPDQPAPDYILAEKGSCSCDSAGPTTSTTAQQQKLKYDQRVQMLSNDPFSELQTTCKFEEHKVTNHKHQLLDVYQEQQKMSNETNFPMDVPHGRKLSWNKQFDRMSESFKPVCTDSGWTESSNPIDLETSYQPNHQNLLVKLLFSSQIDTGCEILVFCKDSEHDERASQVDAEIKTESKNSIPDTQSDDAPQKHPEHSMFSTETSTSREASKFSTSHVFDDFSQAQLAQTFSNADLDKLVDLESKKICSEVPEIKELAKPNWLVVSEIKNGSCKLNQPKEFCMPGEVQNSPEIQDDPTCPDHQDVKKSLDQLTDSEKTSTVCSHAAERDDESAACVICGRDSTLSAPDNSQPPTLTKVNPCLQAADQQSVEELSYLETATLHAVGPTVLDRCSIDQSPNESLVRTLRDSISPSDAESRNNPTGNGLWLKSENLSQSDSPDHFSTVTFPECLQPPLGPIKGDGQELDNTETLAVDKSTANLSAFDSLYCDSNSTTVNEPVRDPGHVPLDPALDSSRPVYAISSFWDEMEKLTINDILHLRLVNNAQPPREVPHQQDAPAADVSDAADSGYFAYPDDSKPDRWTGDASPFSDFEDEFQQTLTSNTNHSPDRQDAQPEVLWSPEPNAEWEDNKVHPTSTGTDNSALRKIKLPFKEFVCDHPISNGTQSIKSKNATVHNLQTSEGETWSFKSLSITPGEEGESSIDFSLRQRPAETCRLAPMEHGDEKMSPHLLVTGIASSENYAMSSPGVSKDLFGEDEVLTSVSGRTSPIVASLPEISLSGRASPIFSSLSEFMLSGRDSPIINSQPETTLPDRTSHIFRSMSENTLSARACQIAISLPETSIFNINSPIAYSLSESNLLCSASPIVSQPESCLSDKATPIVHSISQKSLLDLAYPIVSQPETCLSSRTSPIVVTLPETSLSGRTSPIAVSLPETNLSGRVTPIVVTLPETSLSGRTSPIVISLPETSLSGRATPVVYSFSESIASCRTGPVQSPVSEVNLSDRDSRIASLCDRELNDLTLPETCDFFFSTYDGGNAFFPSLQRLRDRRGAGVPIFSCSRSVKQEYRFVEEYDFVFPEESSLESEDEDRYTPVHMVTRFDRDTHDPLDALVGPDAYEHFYTDSALRGNIFWRNLTSLRRLRFTGGLYSYRNTCTSWAFAVTCCRGRLSPLRTPDPDCTIDDGSSSHLQPNLYQENQLCSEVRNHRDVDRQAVVSFPKRALFFTLRQSDICLVCIAFASWVLRSGNPQSADTWKTALLANVSAISAIQYLRRYMRKNGSGSKR